MIEVNELEQTCGACPSQWEFRTFKNRPVYVRYRWGYLSVRIGPPDGDIYDAVSGYEFVGTRLGEDMDGVLDWEEVYTSLYRLDQGLLEDTLLMKGF